MSVQVKICGLQMPEHARASVAAGADFLGIIFAPSRRQVSVEQARVIAEAARATAAEQGAAIKIVGVFVNERPETINSIVADVGLDWVQLSGHEPLALALELTVPVVKAVRFDGHTSEEAWLAQPDTGVTPGYPLLVDAHVAGSFGGAGVTSDWQSAATVARRWPVWLAGGLSSENVGAAVAAVRPAVVDVSSGVETNGVKDVGKITAFIRAAKHDNTLQAGDVPRYLTTHSL